MRKHFHQSEAFAPLQQILKDRTATELRTSNLNPLRNQLTFHFFESAIGEQLNKGELDSRFGSGKGENSNPYYELADLCTLGAFSGLQLCHPNTVDQFGQLTRDTTDLAARFNSESESFIAKVLVAYGWKVLIRKEKP